MHIVPSLKACTHLLAVSVLLTACKPTAPSSTFLSIAAANAASTSPAKLSADTYRLKTEAAPGEFLGPAIDCDGDGLADDSRIDFNGDGVSDECVEGREEIPEPPFQQAYTPTTQTFYDLLPEVGWSTRYVCGDGLYEVTLSRPTAGEMAYSAQGLTLKSRIIYDDLDPNLNQPLIIRDPEEGMRYVFNQEQDGEFYEYAIADYNGNVGLYIYQTGEQIVAAPCTSDST
ncbi:MAG: hypothetical protein AAFQ74_05960 [Cyanobacteria bacterium J06623_4]